MRNRPLTLITALAASGVFLTACGASSGGGSGDGSTSNPVPAPSVETSSTGATSPSSAASASAASASAAPDSSDAGTTSAAAPSKPTAVNKSFADPVLGVKGTAISYLRGYQPSAASTKKYSALADEEVILVRVKVTASSKYYDSEGADSFYLTGTSNKFDDGTTTILDKEIQAAGFHPLQDALTGKTETGWIVFTPKKGGVTTVTLRYLRLATNLPNGKTLPRKTFDIKLGS